MDYKTMIKELYSIDIKKGSRLGLKNIKELMSKLGNPQEELKIIHVAGTNAKGSVCSMISSILQKRGFKVGMYTSPHLVKFRERIRINNTLISKKDLVKYYNLVKKHITNQTFFEIITAISFLYFKDKKIDYAVMEVGLGGRLDATNIAVPKLSIITNISLEHTQILGKSEEKIAYEKAGIIKKEVPLITSAKGKALKKIKEIAKKRNSKLIIPKKHEKINCRYNINGYKNLKLNLKGDFQLKNSEIAVTAIDALNKYYNTKITISNIKKGLNSVNWPGRFDFIKPNILVDCAHNPSGQKTLSKELKKIKEKYKSIILVIGILNDKDISHMIKPIEKISNKIIITKPLTPRAEDPANISKHIKNKNKIIFLNNSVKKAVRYALKEKTKKDLLVITGSCFTVGEAIKTLSS